MNKVISATILILALGVGSAVAGNYGNSAPQNWGIAPAPPDASSESGANAKASGSKVVPYTASLKLTRLSAVTGVCPDGYANQCASGNCSCNTFTGSGKGSTFGTSSNVTFELTVDLDNQPGDPDGTCFPGFGVILIAGTKDSQIVDVVGAACSNLDGSATFTGGFTFDGPSSILFDGVGPNVAGKFVGSAGGFNLSLSGKACKGTAACLSN